jgi:predicted CXXCH cytochrome family protein
MSKSKKSAAAPAPAAKGAFRKPLGVVLAVAAIAALTGVVYFWMGRADDVSAPALAGKSMQAAKPDFVGAETCAGCHSAEATQWRGSQHAKAMQHATAETVLGDFNDARFEYYGVRSTFFKRDDRFFVTTDGPDGKLADFEIRYVFGIEPLQQYLIEFPDGRLQALSIAWDARPKSKGGQRWYHLYPDQNITPADPLHWTRRDQNWNWMCADCHTTKLDRNFDLASNAYSTTFAEMNVACEACHGPGAKHVDWAKAGADKSAAGYGLAVALDERKGTFWMPDAATGNAVRNMPLESHSELGVCAQCHSRRAPFDAGMDHRGGLLDSHEISLLTDALYHPDGQQRDEVFNAGSFMQSKMHAKGVTCSDCHNPHTGKLKAEGNAVCAQCHQPAKYDAPAHTLHPVGTPGAACASCHMPTETYMGVDARHDHSFRIPRPDESAALGTSNACNACHTDKDAAWAAAAISRHYGPKRKGYQTFGPAFHAASQGMPGAADGLRAIIKNPESPAIVRASATARLRPLLTAATLPAIEAAAEDADPMVRAAAMDAILAAPPQERVRIAAGLIDDPSRIVRIKAARALAIAPDAGMAPPMRARVDKIFAEYVASQEANADRPESHINLGLFYAERRDPLKAEASYRNAMHLAPDYVPAYGNLADLYRMYGRENEAETVLNEGLLKSPGNADLSHALGLVRIRQGRLSDAFPLLAQAALSAPDNPRYTYIHAIALHDSGQAARAIVELEQSLKRFPRNAEILAALVEYTRETGDVRKSAEYGARLQALQAGRQ